MGSSVRYALAAFFVVLSGLGAYATVIGTFFTSDMAEVVNAVVRGDIAALPGTPEPFKRRYLGIPPLDNHLAGLVLFFAGIVDGDVPPENHLTYIWTMAQFFMGWTIILFEGLRVGSRGRLISFVGVFGFLVNNIAWATALPLYLALHLLTSPVATLRNGDGQAGRTFLFAYLWDMALLPFTVIVTAVAPGVIMSIPSLGKQSASTHYKLIAIWQFFPFFNRILQEVLHRFGGAIVGPIQPTNEKGERTTLGKAYMVGVAGVYQFILTFLAAIHLPILALSLLPPSLRQSLAAAAPDYAPYIERGTFSNIFIPGLPWNTPKVQVAGFASGGFGPLGAQFLHYDMYFGFISLLLWAIYLRQTTVKNPDVGTLVRKIVMWLVLGGIYAPVAALLWDRDTVVLENEQPAARAKKTN